jgi:hypothetical protein
VVASEVVPEVSMERVLVRAAAAGLRVWEVSVVVAAEVSAAVVAVGAEVLVAVAAVVVVVAVVAEGGNGS